MRKLIVVASALLGLCLAVNVFGQDASLSGTVADTSGGVIPGATVTATNDNTGIVSTLIANDSGAYNFPRLPFGTYTVKAELDGFQTKTFTDVSLQVGQQARLNFELEVAGVTTEIEVSTSAADILLESSSSVGDVLSAQTVMELPQVGRDALDLIKVMSGVVVSDGEVYGRNNTSFAGVQATGVNIQRDGVTVNDVRFPTGINAATRVNPDMVGEFKMVLAPVDAESGRGNAQVQIATKGGSNAYHGNVVWNVQNTALDPNTWENNRTVPVTVPPWRNLQNLTASVSGPIIKNKTFFFVLFDYQLSKQRQAYNAMSLTPCARKGIFRFWDRWNNQDAEYLARDAESSSTSSNPTIATVDLQGNPLRPAWEPGSTDGVPNWGNVPYTGELRHVSVFGPITNLDELNADCSNAVFDTATSWDPLRAEMDPSGFIDDFVNDKLPMPNNYEIGDGLNTAGFKWTRTQEGMQNLFGVGEDTYRKQINLRIDHNFSNEHRVSGSWSFEKDHADDTLNTWPENSWPGGGINQPQVLSLNFQSSFRPNLLNEFKFGMSRTGSNILGPMSNPVNGTAARDYIAQFGTLYNGEIGVIEPGPTSGDYESFRTDASPAGNASTPYGTRGSWAIADMIDSSPRYTVGDTLTWVRGTHSIKVGGEWRRSSSEARVQWMQAATFVPWGDSFPEYQGGELPATPSTFGNVPDAWGEDSLAGSNENNGNKRAMRDMLIFLSGSLSGIKQARYINTPTATEWNDPRMESYLIRETIMKEGALFVKDDWKVRPDLTLNLGVRWDYYGVPFMGNGMTVGLEGGGMSIFGVTGGYDHWLIPGESENGTLLALRSIGPGGEHPDESLYDARLSNIGPAVGFAWQLPFFGKGKTTLRGGYQISYLSFNGNFSSVQGAASQSPGFNYFTQWSPSGDVLADMGYFGIKDLATNPVFENGVPLQSPAEPGLSEFPFYDRSQSASAYIPNYRPPYVQNLTFAITRNATSNLTVDLRYIGTLTRHNFSSRNINAGSFLKNGLLEAFDAARRGDNPELLDRLFNGVRLPTFGPACVVDGVTCFGGQALRSASSWNGNIPNFGQGWFQPLSSMLAQGNYNTLAHALNTLTRFPGDDKGAYLEDNGFPTNFLVANPQLENATLYDNQGSSNYHSFQAQITLRPTYGLYFQSTYTWSKNLGNSGGVPPDPFDNRTGYVLQGSDRRHNWVTYGNWDLPIGPGKLIGGDLQGIWGNVIGGWQIGWITQVTSGAPLNISATDMMYGNATPDEINGGINPGDADFTWEKDARNGYLFFGGDRYEMRDDPQCDDPSIVDPSIQSRCNFRAVYDTYNDQFVLVNPLPGHLGTMGYNRFRNLGRWNVDMSASKSVAIREGIDFRFRVDVSNIFNHPRPGTPSMNINSSTPIGQVSTKSGNRTLQAMFRIDF